MFEDEKIDFIESLPEADTILIVWVKLLTLAGKCNANGFIFLTEKIPYTQEMLAHKFRRPLNVVKLALETLARLEMIQFNNEGFLKIANWEKHQNVEGLDKIREQTRLRVAKHREKQKELSESNVTCNVTVTEGNATDIEEDKELDRDIEEDIYILSNDEKQFLEVLEQIKSYPLDREKDLEMYKTLGKKYYQLDLLEAIETWRLYKLDKPLKANSNARSQINNSFEKYAEWGKCLKKEGNNGPGAGGNESKNEKDDSAARAGVISL